MHARPIVAVISAAAILLGLPAGGEAQTEPGPAASSVAGGAWSASTAVAGAQAGESFGLATQWTVYHVSRWVPWRTAATPAYDVGSGYVFPVGSTDGDYWTQVDLPAGASVSSVCWLFSDTNPSGQWTFRLSAFESGDFPFSPSETWLSSYSTGTSAVPGYHRACQTLDPAVLIRATGDLDGDLASHPLAYTLQASTTGADGSTLGLFGAEINWSRTISPAPAVATFGDVPVGAFGFQHVEALAASGITAGCGGGDFCPDAPLTRVQMAVFLAKALGLHFPE